MSGVPSLNTGTARDFPYGKEIDLPGTGIRLSSLFDSGNLARAQLVNNASDAEHTRSRSSLLLGARTFHVRLWTTPDAAGTPYETTFRSWFHFKVTGAEDSDVIRFTVANLPGAGKLFQQGMRPFFRVEGEAPFRWERVRSDPTVSVSTPGPEAPGPKTLSLTFEHSFAGACGRAVYFAHCLPHTYAECQSLLSGVEHAFGWVGGAFPPPRDECGSAPVPPPWTVPGDAGFDDAADRNGVYLHRELLARSLCGRRIDMITVSSTKGLLGPKVVDGGDLAALGGDDGVPRENPPPGLFPSAGIKDDDGDGDRYDRVAGGTPSVRNPRNLRSRVFAPGEKPIVFVSARVHPGETPASHVFNGVLAFLLRSSDPRARALRDRFVFKLVPILNPDGVAHGHYRADTRGENLNRHYTAPSRSDHPAVWAVREYLTYAHASLGGVWMYLDLHGHASKRGCFLYGNALPFDEQVESVTYMKLTALNTPHFEFEACNYTEKNMKAKDKRDGLSKEGSGRVGMYKALGITHCYTLECNYNTGRIVNAVTPAAEAGGGEDGRVSPDHNGRGRPPKYTVDIYARVGRALLISLLDLEGINPWSRVRTSTFRSADNVRTYVRSHLRASGLKPAPGAIASTRANSANSGNNHISAGSSNQLHHRKQPAQSSFGSSFGSSRPTGSKNGSFDTSAPNPPPWGSSGNGVPAPRRPKATPLGAHSRGSSSAGSITSTNSTSSSSTSSSSSSSSIGRRRTGGASLIGGGNEQYAQINQGNGKGISRVTRQSPTMVSRRDNYDGPAREDPKVARARRYMNAQARGPVISHADMDRDDSPTRGTFV